MAIRLIEVGKTDASYLIEAETNYEQRLKHFVKFERYTIPDIKNGGVLPKEILKDKEGESILSKINASDYVVLLDENGKEFTSREFSSWIERTQIHHSGNLVFVIGGAFGFSKQLYERANVKLSLSKMTFSHQMIRSFFLEQLYRSFTILKGIKYHHD